MRERIHISAKVLPLFYPLGQFERLKTVLMGTNTPHTCIPGRSGVSGMILMWIPNKNPAGGLGGAVSPPAGFGAAPRKFLKFMVSFTSENLFWQILENFLCVLLQQFSANERPVCNM